MIRLSLFISLLLTSVAVLADVQINIKGHIYVPPCTINNGQNITVNFSNVDPGKVGMDPQNTSQGKVTEMVGISCPYNSGSPWIYVTGTTADKNSLSTNITNLRIALYQGSNMSTRLMLGSSGDKAISGLDIASSTFTFTSVLFKTGALNGGDFNSTANISIVYK